MGAEHRNRRRGHGVDAGRDGHRADDDAAWAGALLLRHGAQKERARHHGPELRGGGCRFAPLDDLRLRPLLHRRRRLYRRLRPDLPERDHDDIRQPLREDDPRNPVYDVPDDLRDHHGCAGCRRGRGENALFRVHAVFGFVADLRLHPDRALGVGRRFPRLCGPPRLRGRHRRAYQCRHRRTGSRPHARQAERLWLREPCPV